MSHSRKRLFFTFLFQLLIFLVSCDRSGPISFRKDPSIRVLITRAVGKKCSVESTAGCKIWNANNRMISYMQRLPAVQVSSQNYVVFLNDQKCSKDSIRITPEKDSILKINDIPYRGELTFISENNQIAAINTLPMDDYVAGVLGGEMPLSWPDSALRAQAIVARSYALYEKIHSKRPFFDVYDTTASQVYKGMSLETERSRSIVLETRGMVLLYQNALFKTFFHSTCGGHTASANKVFDYQDITPLSGRPCSFCSHSKHFSWEYTADMSQLNQMVLGAKLSLPLVAIAPLEKEKNGRIVNLQIYYEKEKKSVIPASMLRNYLGNDKVKSTMFIMSPAPNGIIFKGKGWGHGVGLCQMGAFTMAEKGCTTSEILLFYYPGSNIYRIWK